MSRKRDQLAEGQPEDDAPILDTCIKLEPEAWRRLLELLERPPQPSPALIELFRKHGRNV